MMTGIVVGVGLFPAELSIGFIGFLLIGAGGLGVLADVLFIIPAEVLIIDVDLGVQRYLYDVAESGTMEGQKPEFIVIPVIKDILGR